MSRRSDGWRRAKITGHQNEEIVAENLGGEYTTLNKKVPSIFGDKTVPKRDLYGPQKITLKKSKGGQVFLTDTSKFILGYEKIYEPIPIIVKDCLLLLFGGHKNIYDIHSQIIHPNIKIFQTERKRKTLCVESIRKFDENLLIEIRIWFSSNIDKITEFVFKRGYAKNVEDFADILLYKNSLGENTLNEIFEIENQKNRCLIKNDILFGEKNGGTTINLPFGHVQWHQGKIQFHHNYSKIKLLFED